MSSQKNEQLRRISVDLPIDLINRFDKLKEEWGLRRRGAVLERLLEEISKLSYSGINWKGLKI